MTTGGGDGSATVKGIDSASKAPAASKGMPIAEPPIVPSASDLPSQRSMLSDGRNLTAGMLGSSQGKQILILACGVTLVLIALMFGQVRLNNWQGAFFDAIERKNLGEVQRQLQTFLVIVAFLLAAVVSQTWLQEMMKIRLREWLTHRLLDDWLVAGRAYRLAITAETGVNPDQRMQEDTRNLSELTSELGIGFLHHILLLVTFVGVLWGLSSQVTFEIGSTRIAIPGYMVWCAIAYAAIGSSLTWLVGRNLVVLNTERYAREAEFRFGLVRASERAEAIALYRGEGDERRIINGMLESVLSAFKRLAFALAKLTWITSGYGWIAILVPVLVALPGYLQGSLTLGGLMMVVGAFNQVQAALKWFVDNFAKIADWRAAFHRVSVFHESLRALDETDPLEEQIEFKDHPEGHLAFEQVSVLLADGRVVIEDATATITPGQRVLIVGESGTGKSTLFRAIAGLWPWGSGTILLPPRNEMMFMPQHPYLPLGTLRSAASYPDPPTKFSNKKVVAALERVGLEDFIDLLDREERWDHLMSLGQQQRLAFARLLLHQPKWVFLDEATGALDIENQARVMSIFENELQTATIISIGHRPSLEEFHGRVLQLVPAADGARLMRRPKPKNAVSGIGWLAAISGWTQERFRKAKVESTARER